MAATAWQRRGHRRQRIRRCCRLASWRGVVIGHCCGLSLSLPLRLLQSTSALGLERVCEEKGSTATRKQIFMVFHHVGRRDLYGKKMFPLRTTARCWLLAPPALACLLCHAGRIDRQQQQSVASIFLQHPRWRPRLLRRSFPPSLRRKKGRRASGRSRAST